MSEETKEKEAVFQYIRQLGPGLLLASAAEAPARVRPQCGQFTVNLREGVSV